MEHIDKVFPNYYNLLMISDLPDFDEIESLFYIDRSKSVLLKDCLRDGNSYVGHYNGLVIISANSISSFYNGRETPLIRTVKSLSQNRDLLVTQYYSVTDAEGLVRIKKGETVALNFTDMVGTPTIGVNDFDCEMVQDSFCVDALGCGFHELLAKPILMWSIELD